MDRRTFLRNCALLAAGAVAVDQLDLLERLAPKRLWQGWTAPPPVLRHQVRVGLPSVHWRLLNQGVRPLLGRENELLRALPWVAA